LALPAQRPTRLPPRQRYVARRFPLREEALAGMEQPVAGVRIVVGRMTPLVHGKAPAAAQHPGGWAVDHTTFDQLAYVIQFVHPEKILEGLPGLNDGTVAAIFGLRATAYSAIRAGFTDAARRAAQELLADPAFAERVERLPFAAGARVVGLGD